MFDMTKWIIYIFGRDNTTYFNTGSSNNEKRLLLKHY